MTFFAAAILGNALYFYHMKTAPVLTTQATSQSTAVLVEVFKTSVTSVHESECLLQCLLQHFPGAKANFDLSDCDHILRMEGVELDADAIIFVLEKYGYTCERLL